MPEHRVPRPSRRVFLAHGAAAAGALALARDAQGGASTLPIPVAPPRPPLGADEPLRIGIIGLGGMGRGHLEAILSQVEAKEANVSVVALAEVCKPRLEAAVQSARDRQGIAVEGFRDYRELLRRGDVHGVLIASPEHWHAQMAVDSIAVGKDVYLEKPMTLRMREALWLDEVTRANPDVIVQVGTQYMMLGKYQAARRLIAEGAIGHPTLSQTSYCRNSRAGEWLYDIDPNVQPGEILDWELWCGPLGRQEWDTELFHRWRRYRRCSTGIIGDLLVHMMTPLVYAVDPGWPVRVSASGGHFVDDAMENHDQVLLSIDFEKEHTMVVAGSTCNEQGMEPMIRGHQANLYLGGDDCVLRPERVFVDDVDEQIIQCEHVDPQAALRLDWFRSMRTREPNASPVELATKVMVVVDLATRSLWEGPAFRFDPQTREARLA